jgi:hypothetical protein
MSRKRPYKKPFVASKKVFSLTSQPCDADLIIPGPCADGVMWTGCDFTRKSPDDLICVGPIVKPIYKS